MSFSLRIFFSCSSKWCLKEDDHCQIARDQWNSTMRSKLLASRQIFTSDLRDLFYNLYLFLLRERNFAIRCLSACQFFCAVMRFIKTFQSKPSLYGHFKNVYLLLQLYTIRTPWYTSGRIFEDGQGDSKYNFESCRLGGLHFSPIGTIVTKKEDRTKSFPTSNQARHGEA